MTNSREFIEKHPTKVTNPPRSFKTEFNCSLFIVSTTMDLYIHGTTDMKIVYE